MYSDRKVFGLGRFIALRQGTTVPPLQRDVFHTNERVAKSETDNLHVFWAKAMMRTEAGAIHDVEKVEIAEYDEQGNEYEVLYQGILKSDGSVQTYYFLASEDWLEDLDDIAERIGIYNS